MHCRFATQADAPLLARMNQQLIRDERHRNPMSLPELEQRMARWLAGEYRAVIFSDQDTDVGYALYKREPEWLYLRQFFIHPDHRRHGLGRTAAQWLIANPFKDAPRIRLDVLIHNAPAIAFWHALDFNDYGLTMERELPNRPP